MEASKVLFEAVRANDGELIVKILGGPTELASSGLPEGQELQILETLLGRPRTPMVAVMGGAKVSDKILVIENLLPKVDQLLIGGAMTYTFLKAQGLEADSGPVPVDEQRDI